LILAGGGAASAVMRPALHEGINYIWSSLTPGKSDSEIVEIVAKMNKVLPKKFDDTTTVKRVTYSSTDGNVRNIKILTTINGNARGIDIGSLRKTVFDTSRTKFCASKVPFDIVKDNLNVSIDYFTDNGDYLTTVVIHPKDCSS
jgi:hypothetical protein